LLFFLLFIFVLSYGFKHKIPFLILSLLGIHYGLVKQLLFLAGAND
jgi:uncharacterized membrane protein